MKPQYTLNLGRYNLSELECFLDAGIISVPELEAELAIRPALLNSETILTPPGSRCTTDESE